MILQPPSPLPESAIRDAVAAVFRAAEYNRRVSRPVLARLFAWLNDLLDAIGKLLRPIGHLTSRSPAVRWALIAILCAVAGAIVARLVYAAYLRRSRGVGRGLARAATARRRDARDPWLVAQEEAARGNFTDAAHALYRALLEAAARQGHVRLHPSKTIGDYVRELRARSSALATRFRDFARSYETVIYGVGFCDRDRYERLRALALPLLRPRADA